MRKIAPVRMCHMVLAIAASLQVQLQPISKDLQGTHSPLSIQRVAGRITASMTDFRSIRPV